MIEAFAPNRSIEPLNVTILSLQRGVAGKTGTALSAELRGGRVHYDARRARQLELGTTLCAEDCIRKTLVVALRTEHRV